jgi:hypothetical protein
MDAAYETVLAQKRQEILVEIEESRKEAAEISVRIAMKEAQLKNIDDLLAIEGGRMTPISNRQLEEGGGDGRARSLVDEAAGALAAAGKPTHYRQLVSLLADRNVYVPGKDPGANLIAHISRDDRFVRTGRGIYGLAEWPSVASSGSRARSRSRSKRKTKR